MVAPGIITNGLGGNATSMIVGQFNLGFAFIEIEVTPPPTFGGGALPTADQKQLVIIRVKYQNKKWEKQYMVSKKRAGIIVKVSKAINRIITNISVKIQNFRQKIKIKVRKK